MTGVPQESIDEVIIKVRNDENTALTTIFEFEVFRDSWRSAVFILDKRKEDVK